jgi:pimeloyl-ACP methyl ester carboxylesterase
MIANFPPTEIMLSRIDAMMAFDRSKDLAKIKAPTLIVGAADDNWSPRPITARPWPAPFPTPS